MTTGTISFTKSFILLGINQDLAPPCISLSLSISERNLFSCSMSPAMVAVFQSYRAYVPSACKIIRPCQFHQTLYCSRVCHSGNTQ